MVTPSFTNTTAMGLGRGIKSADLNSGGGPVRGQHQHQHQPNMIAALERRETAKFAWESTESAGGDGLRDSKDGGLRDSKDRLDRIDEHGDRGRSPVSRPMQSKSNGSNPNQNQLTSSQQGLHPMQRVRPELRNSNRNFVAAKGVHAHAELGKRKPSKDNSLNHGYQHSTTNTTGFRLPAGKKAQAQANSNLTTPSVNPASTNVSHQGSYGSEQAGGSGPSQGAQPRTQTLQVPGPVAGSQARHKPNQALQPVSPNLTDQSSLYDPSVLLEKSGGWTSLKAARLAKRTGQTPQLAEASLMYNNTTVADSGIDYNFRGSRSQNNQYQSTANNGQRANRELKREHTPDTPEEPVQPERIPRSDALHSARHYEDAPQLQPTTRPVKNPFGVSRNDRELELDAPLFPTGPRFRGHMAAGVTSAGAGAGNVQTQRYGRHLDVQQQQQAMDLRASTDSLQFNESVLHKLDEIDHIKQVGRENHARMGPKY